jgi:hypothetical protein
MGAADEALAGLEARAGAGPLPRYCLAITGTSQAQLRELEAQARLEGWIVLGATTRTGRPRPAPQEVSRHRPAVPGVSSGWSAVYIATDDPPATVADAIGRALPSMLVDVGVLEPIDPHALAAQYEALKAARASFSRGRFRLKETG